jgi:membrane dipeptidase
VKGGVVGLYFMPFLRTSGQAGRDDLIRHIEHALSVAGEDHIGIGTDGGIAGIVIDDAMRQRQRAFFERRQALGIASPGEAADVFNIIPEYNDSTRYIRLAQDLSSRGWPSARIDKLLGANFARLYRDTWG